MNFRVGQDVICVDAAQSDGRLAQGQRYRVKAISSLSDRSTTLVLEGAPHPRCDHGWLKSRFRPAVERKTDISVFTAMLTSQKPKERV